MFNSQRSFLMLSGSFSQRAYGALLLVFGLIAIITAFSAGAWAISILGLILLLAGVVQIVHGLQTQLPSSTWATYLTGVLMILGGLLLFARPVMVIGGLLALIALLMVADGVAKIVRAFKGKARSSALVDNFQRHRQFPPRVADLAAGRLHGCRCSRGRPRTLHHVYRVDGAVRSRRRHRKRRCRSGGQ